MVIDILFLFTAGELSVLSLRLQFAYFRAIICVLRSDFTKPVKCGVNEVNEWILMSSQANQLKGYLEYSVAAVFITFLHLTIYYSFLFKQSLAHKRKHEATGDILDYNLWF